MAQIFHRSTNFISRFSVFSALFLIGFAVLAVLGVARSPYMTRKDITREQPVQFSHKHHVADDGIDCRYCHTSVETSAVAGIPPTKTCMNCHSVLFNTAPYLEPIRESYRTDKSIEWVKVHRLADFVYFDHSRHISSGLICQECHGPIETMEHVRREYGLKMSFCLACHKQDPPPGSHAAAQGWETRAPIYCTTCHR